MAEEIATEQKVQALSLNEAVKRVFSIQEERKAEYERLKRTQEAYTSSLDPLAQESLSQYQLEISSVTSKLSSVSQDMKQLCELFREHGLTPVCSIVVEIQTLEKEKLQLLVQYHVTQQKSKQDSEIEEGDIESNTHSFQLRELRRKLAVCDSRISSLLEDMRFECEHLLLNS